MVPVPVPLKINRPTPSCAALGTERLFVNSASAQDPLRIQSNGADALFVDDTRNVGVGTIAPIRQFTMVGLNSDSAVAALLPGASDKASTLYLGGQADLSGNFARWSYNGATKQLKLQGTHNTSPVADIMTFDWTSGLSTVAIGAAPTSSRLTIASASSTTAGSGVLQVQNNSTAGYAGLFSALSNVNAIGIKAQSAGTAAEFLGNAGGGTEPAVVVSGGDLIITDSKIGVGTSTPIRQFTMVGLNSDSAVAALLPGAASKKSKLYLGGRADLTGDFASIGYDPATDYFSIGATPNTLNGERRTFTMVAGTGSTAIGYNFVGNTPLTPVNSQLYVESDNVSFAANGVFQVKNNATSGYAALFSSPNGSSSVGFRSQASGVAAEFLANVGGGTEPAIVVAGGDVYIYSIGSGVVMPDNACGANMCRRMTLNAGAWVFSACFTCP